MSDCLPVQRMSDPKEDFIRHEKRGIVISPFTSPNGWQMVADGSRPIPLRAHTQRSGRSSSPPPQVEAALMVGKVTSTNWQGGVICTETDPPRNVQYHKSDVWVDDKKVKQLPREGDTVTFYLACDEVSKKEKAEQVTVVNQKGQIPNVQTTPVKTSNAKNPTTPKVTKSNEGSTNAQRSPLNPTAPSFKPKTIPTTPTKNGSPSSSFEHTPTKPTIPHVEPGTPESSYPFLFENCTGTVIQVSVPTGQIRLDGVPEGTPPIPYHYSDVWDDGKCVKQFPREGDIVECYIGLNSKTKTPKAEMVKVVPKRQENATPLKTQEQRSSIRTHTTPPPTPPSQPSKVALTSSPSLRYGPPPLSGPMFPDPAFAFTDDYGPPSPGPMHSYPSHLVPPLNMMEPSMLMTTPPSVTPIALIGSPSPLTLSPSAHMHYSPVPLGPFTSPPHPSNTPIGPYPFSQSVGYSSMSSSAECSDFSEKELDDDSIFGAPLLSTPTSKPNRSEFIINNMDVDGLDSLVTNTAESVLRDDSELEQELEKLCWDQIAAPTKVSKNVSSSFWDEDLSIRVQTAIGRCTGENGLAKSPILGGIRRNSNPFHYAVSVVD